MQKLNLPYYNFKFKCENSKTYIFDEIRKKWIKLNLEEWVRQNFIKYLVNEKQYPASLFGIEFHIKVNKMDRRGDIVIFNNLGKPHLIVECKAPDVKITQHVFDQIANYNIPLKVEYLVVTNGMQHFCCKMNYTNNRFKFIEEIPNYLLFKY